MKFISADQVHSICSFPELVSELESAHREPPTDSKDLFLTNIEPEYSLTNVLLVRAAWNHGSVLGLKAATTFPQNTLNSNLPSVHAIYSLFDGVNGMPIAIIDGTSMTYYKTAADSALGSKYLAQPGITRMAMVGAGAMAPYLIQAHCEILGSISHVTIWNRTQSRAQALAQSLKLSEVQIEVSNDLESTVRNAQIVSSATMTKAPIIDGQWLAPGTHLDLIGAFTPEMREVNDEAITRSKVFVDSRKSVIGEIGEITIPIETGVMREEDVIADLYQLCSGSVRGRTSELDITLFKNGGGGHLDLMTAQFIFRQI